LRDAFVNLRPLVDFHCHLDLYPDHAAAVNECERLGVFTLAVTTTPRAWPRNHQLASATRHVRAALGLHPQLVQERAQEFSIWDEYLPRARYIGEVGLDASPRFYSSLDTQKLAFERILRACARAGGKILTIHSVRSVAMVLNMLEAHLPASRGKAVLHWFTGTKAEARRALDLGCYFSINSRMLENDRHRATIVSLPNECLLTETDGPFVQFEGRPVRPPDVEATVMALARLRSAEPAFISATIGRNLKSLLSD